MAGKPAVTVTGAVETQRALRRMGDSLGEPAFHLPAGELVRDRALELVPRVSGALADTIELVVQPDGTDVVAGSPTVPYAGVIEFGWDDRGIAARHYLAGALDESADAVHDVYAREVGELVDRVHRES